MNSLTMGALTLGTGIAVKWLMQQKNRQKIYNALETVLADSTEYVKSSEGKLSQAKSKVREWVGLDSEVKNGGRKKAASKKITNE